MALGPTARSWSWHFCGSGILKSDDLKCARGYFRVISQILRELRVRYCPLLFLLLQKPRHFSSSWQLQSGFSKTDHSGIFGSFEHGCRKLHIWQLHVFSGHTCQQKWLFATAFPLVLGCLVFRCAIWPVYCLDATGCRACGHSGIFGSFLCESRGLPVCACIAAGASLLRASDMSPAGVLTSLYFLCRSGGSLPAPGIWSFQNFWAKPVMSVVCTGLADTVTRTMSPPVHDR